MNKDYFRVGALVPEIRVANPDFNANEIIKEVRGAYDKGVEVVATPELSLTGATCGDLFFQDVLIDEVNKAIARICEETKDIEITLLLGTPIRIENRLYNVVLVINKGKILGFVPKRDISLQEMRWFDSGKELLDKDVSICYNNVRFDRNVFGTSNHEKAVFAVLMCSEKLEYINPDNKEVFVVFNTTSNYDLVSRTKMIKMRAMNISADNRIACVYLMPGLNESTTDNVYSGYSLIIDDGVLMREGEKYSFESRLNFGDIILDKEQKEYKLPNEELKDKKSIKENDKYPFVPDTPEEIEERVKEILEIQSSALARRLKQIRSYKAVIGLSGGSDSTLALIVTAKAFAKLSADSRDIITVTMPGFGTSNRTYNNSIALAKSYNTTLMEISIKDACTQHYKDIGLPEGDRSVTYENAQARERTQILMDVANKVNGLVVGTGDLSELALGWCTYNGDHMSSYAVNANVPKTLIRHIIEYEAKRTKNEALFDVINTPISPELLPPDEKGEIKQKTESSIGPYALHDFFLYHFLKYHSTPEHLFNIALKTFENDFSKEEIIKWLGVFMRRFITQQFKRNCMPDGPKVGSIGLSPRGDLVMPSDVDGSIWSI